MRPFAVSPGASISRVQAYIGRLLQNCEISEKIPSLSAATDGGLHYCQSYARDYAKLSALRQATSNAASKSPSSKARLIRKLRAQMPARSILSFNRREAERISKNPARN